MYWSLLKTSLRSVRAEMRSMSSSALDAGSPQNSSAAATVGPAAGIGVGPSLTIPSSARAGEAKTKAAMSAAAEFKKLERDIRDGSLVQRDGAYIPVFPVGHQRNAQNVAPSLPPLHIASTPSSPRRRGSV